MTDAFKTCVPFEAAGELSQLLALYEPERKTLWMMLQPKPRPSFNMAVLDEILRVDGAVKECGLPVHFRVLGSTSKSMFNVGGDLAHFAAAIRAGDREGLLRYARRCVEAVHLSYSGLHAGVVTVATVEGTALGGGFESALANHFVLAQKDARMGFPEIAFNLFPGMGAYSFVARRASMVVAEKLILSGEAHTGEWHETQGLVDHTFEPGEGIQYTRSFIDSLVPRLNGVRAMLRARDRVLPVSRAELMDITEDWVDAAFSLEPKDLGYMERLVLLQNKRSR